MKDYGRNIPIDLAGVSDGPTRRNFESLRDFLRDYPLANFFGRLVTITVGKNDAGAVMNAAHGLSFRPVDVIILSVLTVQTDTETAAGTTPALATVTVDPRFHTASTLCITASHACQVRALVGTLLGG